MTKSSVLSLFVGLLLRAGPQQPSTLPAADHHLHLVSPEAAKLLAEAGIERGAWDDRQVITQFDDAGIQIAVVLSTAYWFSSPVMPKPQLQFYFSSLIVV